MAEKEAKKKEAEEEISVFKTKIGAAKDIYMTLDDLCKFLKQQLGKKAILFSHKIHRRD